MELDELETLFTAAALIGLLSRSNATLNEVADSAIQLGQYTATKLKLVQAEEQKQ